MFSFHICSICKTLTHCNLILAEHSQPVSRQITEGMQCATHHFFNQALPLNNSNLSYIYVIDNRPYFTTLVQKNSLFQQVRVVCMLFHHRIKFQISFFLHIFIQYFLVQSSINSSFILLPDNVHLFTNISLSLTHHAKRSAVYINEWAPTTFDFFNEFKLATWSK